MTRNSHEAGRLRLRGGGRCQGDTFTAFVRPGVVSIRAIATFSKRKIDAKIHTVGLGKARPSCACILHCMTFVKCKGIKHEIILLTIRA